MTTTTAAPSPSRTPTATPNPPQQDDDATRAPADADAAASPPSVNMAEQYQAIHALLGTLSSSPHAHDMLDLTLAVVSSIDVSKAEESDPVWLLFPGTPGSGKTSTVLLANESPKVRYLDKITEEAFNSAARDAKTGQRATSLLLELDGRCLIVKELVTILGSDPKKVRALFTTLNSVYDGSLNKGGGLSFGTTAAQNATGLISFIACTTRAAYEQHQELLGEIGSRYLVFRVPDLTKERRRAGYRVQKDPKVTARVRALVSVHLAAISAGAVTIPPQWDVWLQVCGELVAQGRRFARTVPGGGRILGDIEEPFRVVTQLRTLLRALTAVRGLLTPGLEELDLIRRVALSTVVPDLASVLEVMRQQPVTAYVEAVVDGAPRCIPLQGTNVATVATALGLDTGAARDRLDKMVTWGLLETVPGAKDKEPGPGRPGAFYRPLETFRAVVFDPPTVLDRRLLDDLPEDRHQGV